MGRRICDGAPNLWTGGFLVQEHDYLLSTVGVEADKVNNISMDIC